LSNLLELWNLESGQPERTPTKAPFASAQPFCQFLE